jgi:hypothetical protein
MCGSGDTASYFKFLKRVLLRWLLRVADELFLTVFTTSQASTYSGYAHHDSR